MRRVGLSPDTVAAQDRRPASPARRLWAHWTVLAQCIGDFQSRLILTLMYFTVVTPIAVLVRLRRRPARSDRPSTWTFREPVPTTIDQARRQY